jgi:hypothetical protein
MIPMKPTVKAYDGDDPYAFVCYAHLDAARVYPELAWINEQACRIWYDEGIALGSVWRDEIAETILRSKLLIMYVSAASTKSEECLKELGFALDHDIPVLAIFLESLELSPGLKLSLQNRQGIERDRYDEEAYRIKLTESIRRIFEDPAANKRTRAPAPDHRGDFDLRYELRGQIAGLGYGRISQAFDRLKGKVVTIKHEQSNSRNQVDLARELKILSELKHPNIVSVLDFGVDAKGCEYSVLDLPTHAQSLTEAALNQPGAVQVDLLSQGLRAIHHIHRKRYIHGLIEPNGIVVVDGQLKLLDFSASVRIGDGGHPSAQQKQSSYAAPELLAGAQLSAASDLYAYGLAAYEAFTGIEPLAERRLESNIDLPRSADQLDPRLTDVFQGLLAFAPEQRFQSAHDALLKLDGAADGVFVETALTRESALQTATFVGRKNEMDLLERALEQARRGRGDAIFVGGESGVGKSRLINELEIKAMTSGFKVLRGTAVESDTGSFRIWEEIARHLSVLANRAEESSSIGIENEDQLDERSFLKLESLLLSQTHPVLIYLEDLHWAGTESLKLLSWLLRPIKNLQVLIVGTFRPDQGFMPVTDEMDARYLELGRLGPEEVSELATTILGTAPDERMREFLAHETEGNSLFIVETLRVLAEEAGSLESITASRLPATVLSGGMRKVMSRRLSRLDAEDLSVLQIAAAIGRAIDQELLQELNPDMEIEVWAKRCKQEAVLEYENHAYRFSHEKIREYVLNEMDQSARETTHRRIAQGLLSRDEDGTRFATTLAYHWEQVGNTDEMARFSLLAGHQSLNGGALTEAVEYYNRVDQLLSGGAKIESDNAHASVEVGLSDAYYRLGNLAECTLHSQQAVRGLGASIPKSATIMAATTLIELVKTRKPKHQHHPQAVEIARAHLRLTDVYFYALKQLEAIWSTLRAANSAKAAASPPELAQAYALMGVLAGGANLKSLGREYAYKALKTSRSTGDARNRSWVLIRLATQSLSDCDWRKAKSRAEIAQVLAHRCGDLRLVEESSSLVALSALFTGQYTDSASQFAKIEVLAHRVGDRQIACWGAQGEAISLVRLGRSEEAREIILPTVDVVHDPYMRIESINTHGILAICDQRGGESARATAYIELALGLLEKTPPMAYWTQPGLGFVVEALFAIAQGDTRDKFGKMKKSALRSLNTFARNQPLGRPIQSLWNAVALAERGQKQKAMNLLQQGIKRPETMSMPYDSNRLKLELIKLGDLSIDKNKVAAEFERMDCRYELETQIAPGSAR